MRNEKAPRLKWYLLQWEEFQFSPSWQIPFHFLGIGPYPSSEKLASSGHIPDLAKEMSCDLQEERAAQSQLSSPESRMPIITSVPFTFCHRPLLV